MVKPDKAIPIPEALHHDIKLVAFQKGKTIKQYCVEVLLNAVNQDRET